MAAFGVRRLQPSNAADRGKHSLAKGQPAGGGIAFAQGKSARGYTLHSRLSPAIFVVCIALGCALSPSAPLELRTEPPAPFFSVWRGPSSQSPSERTQQFLRRHHLVHRWEEEDPRVLLRHIQEIIERDPSEDKIFAAAELAYLAARTSQARNDRLALDFYGAAVIHAFQYLFDDRFRDGRNPYDPQFRGACELYNASLEGLLRLVCREQGLEPGRSYSIQTASGQWRLRCEIRAGLWQAEEFGRFEFVNDYAIRNLQNHYRTYGLGVPLIAVRRPLEQEPPVARFYPEGLTIPITVFLRPDFDPDPYASNVLRQRSGTLELYDPLVTSDIRVGELWVPLQTDLTTPLAYLLADERWALSSIVGLFRPEQLLRLEPRRGKPLMGLYMLQPYERGKIPVVMIHGLWSSPMTWVEMFNELRSLPEIRRHFQFWFFWYPTAQPFWIPAATLREELAEVRHVLDPYHQDWTLDQMVLVGHSMGGLVARLQTVDSADRFWRLVSDYPFDFVRADPSVRQRMQKVLFFQPSPAVARVIFIATPHRGSRASNLTTQWILERLIRLPEFVVEAHSEFYRFNREVIRDPRLLRIDTSVEALDPNSPFFAALEACPKAPWVKWHSIVGILPSKSLVGKLAAGADGVVSYRSAHLEEAESELIVAADHLTIHAHPLAVQEVRRILLEHLAELQSRPRPSVARWQPDGLSSERTPELFPRGGTAPRAEGALLAPNGPQVNPPDLSFVGNDGHALLFPPSLSPETIFPKGEFGWPVPPEAGIPLRGAFPLVKAIEPSSVPVGPRPAQSGWEGGFPSQPAPGIPWAVGTDILRR